MPLTIHPEEGKENPRCLREDRVAGPERRLEWQEKAGAPGSGSRQMVEIKAPVAL